jgi:hypothetical protein
VKRVVQNDPGQEADESNDERPEEDARDNARAPTDDFELHMVRLPLADFLLRGAALTTARITIPTPPTIKIVSSPEVMT